MEKLTDEQLIAVYLKGDRQALNLLIKRYLTPIYNFAFNYTKDEAAAEDLTQEVFVKVWKKIEKFNPQYKFKSWLYIIAKNTCLNYLKKNKAIAFSRLDNGDGFIFERLIEETSPSPQTELELKETAAVINSVIEKLPEKYQQIVKLRYLGGYKFREIAGMFKESIETVKSRNRRALIRLKKFLKE